MIAFSLRKTPFQMIYGLRGGGKGMIDISHIGAFAPEDCFDVQWTWNDQSMDSLTPPTFLPKGDNWWVDCADPEGVIHLRVSFKNSVGQKFFSEATFLKRSEERVVKVGNESTPATFFYWATEQSKRGLQGEGER